MGPLKYQAMLSFRDVAHDGVLCTFSSRSDPQGADSLQLPTPLRVEKTDKNHLDKEMTPLLPTGIGETFSRTISNLGHAALLPMLTPPINDMVNTSVNVR